MTRIKRNLCNQSETTAFVHSNVKIPHEPFSHMFNFFCFFSVCEKSVDITPLCNASDLPSHFGLEDHKVDAATMS